MFVLRKQGARCSRRTFYILRQRPLMANVNGVFASSCLMFDSYRCHEPLLSTIITNRIKYEEYTFHLLMHHSTDKLDQEDVIRLLLEYYTYIFRALLSK